MIHLYDNGINGILADEMGLGKTLQVSVGRVHQEKRGLTEGFFDWSGYKVELLVELEYGSMFFS